MRVAAVSLLSVSAAGVAQASILKRQDSVAPRHHIPSVSDYFEGVCLPSDPNNLNNLDWDTPCAQIYLIGYTCTIGSNATWEIINGPQNATQYGVEAIFLSPRDQQICACESQYFNAMQGCLDCAEKHGIASAVAPQLKASAITSFSSSYCAVTNTPTANFTHFIGKTFEGVFGLYAATATTWSDPIGNKTDVSLYYTPSVTGTAAYSFYEPGASSWGGSVTSSVSINTSNGQIVATAVAVTTGTSTSGTTAAAASTATKTGAAPLVTPPTEKLAIAGVLGLAAVVAAL